jgi:hypothetical protein
MPAGLPMDGRKPANRRLAEAKTLGRGSTMTTMTFMMLRRDASEVRSLTYCGLCRDKASPRDHLLVGQPGSTAGVGLCERCGDALISLTELFGRDFSLKIEQPFSAAG